MTFSFLPVSLLLVGLVASAQEGRRTPPKSAKSKAKSDAQRLGGGVAGTGMAVSGSQVSTSRIVDFGPQPNETEKLEMKLLEKRLISACIAYFNALNIGFWYSIDQGSLKITNGSQIYENPYINREKLSEWAFSNVEGPSPGCFLFRISANMRDYSTEIRLSKPSKFIFGIWCMARTGIRNKRYVINFDYMAGDEGFEASEQAIRKVISEVIATMPSTPETVKSP